MTLPINDRPSCGRRQILTRLTSALGLAMVAPFVGGCGMIRASYARETTLARELDAYVIEKPLEEVWPKVTDVSGDFDQLLWDGFKHSWRDVEPYRKRTKTRREESDYGDTHTVEVTWLEVEGIAAANGCQVRYYENVRATDERPSSAPTTQERRERRYDLELELVRRFDQAAASRIEAAAERAARSA